MINRELYMEQITPFIDKPFVKVITGIRRCGKSVVLRLIREENFAEALDVARQQVEAGALVIDINMDEGMLDGVASMVKYLRLIAYVYILLHRFYRTSSVGIDRLSYPQDIFFLEQYRRNCSKNEYSN